MTDKTFNPQEHLSKVGKADYLQVMWRLVWFDEKNPDGKIETEMIEHTMGQYAVFKARVTCTNGRIATGYGSETKTDFLDYLEKAETKAIGRALAAAGYGTQFSAHEFGSEHEADRPVDSPVGGKVSAPARTAPQNVSQERPTISNPNAPASPPQINFITGLAKECGYVVQGPDGADHLDEVGFSAYVGSMYQSDWPRITKGTASALIEQLQAERDERRAKSATQAPMMPVGADRWTS